MYNKVELCGVNTAELPILSEQEKRDLLTRARAGDKKARQSMIEGNLRLVLSVVQRFSQRGENMDDLFQVGCIGLIKAIDNFDPAQQVRFSTYGVPMIIGEIRRFLRDNNALRVSRSLRDTAYRAMQSREELEKQLGREPTVDEIAQKTGLSRREVSAALESVVEPLSLEEPVYADGGDAVYVIDQVRDPDGEDSWISGLQFRQTVAGLTASPEEGDPCFPLTRLVVFFPGGRAAPQMALGLVPGQHHLHLPEQLRAYRPQPHRHVFVYGGLAAAENPRRRPHGGPMLHDVLSQQQRPLFRITFHDCSLPPKCACSRICDPAGRYAAGGLTFGGERLY